MANIKDWIKDKVGNIFIPKTLTSAVYDDNNIPLSDTLDTLNSNLSTDYSKNSFLIKEGTNRYLYCLNSTVITINTQNAYNQIGAVSIKPNKDYYAPAIFGINADFSGLIRIDTSGTISVYIANFTGDTYIWCQLRFYTD